MIFPKLEGDGLLEDFYDHLWKRSREDTGKREFFLPQTVIYKHNKPIAWYFSTPEKTLEKKSEKEIDLSRVMKSFLKKLSPSGIIASFTFTTGNGREIEYFTEENFTQFLHLRQKIPDGILQQFLHPKSPKNTLIKLIWSPKVCLYECRENRKEICDFRSGIYERAVTVEGQDYYSRSIVLKGTELKKKLNKMAENIVIHVKEVSDNITLKRMVLLLKIDSQNRLCLLRALSLRTSGEVPLDIGSSIKLPETISLKNPVKGKPAIDKNPIVCHSCNDLVTIKQLYKLPYQFIVDFYNSKAIPAVIAKNHPHISKKMYQFCVKDNLFLKQTMMVCCDCYMKYTSGKLEPTIARRLDFDSLKKGTHNLSNWTSKQSLDLKRKSITDRINELSSPNTKMSFCERKRSSLSVAKKSSLIVNKTKMENRRKSLSRFDKVRKSITKGDTVRNVFDHQIKFIKKTSESLFLSNNTKGTNNLIN